MFFPEFGGNPDDGPRPSACGIGDALAEMIVVRLRELVLDHERAPMCEVASEKIKEELADRVLVGRELDLQADRGGEFVGVFEQPGCEVVRLMRPHLLWVDGLQGRPVPTVGARSRS